MAANYLEKSGYTITGNSIFSTRPTWLSSKSTILYYHDKSLKKAEDIASDLKNNLEISFQVNRGAGLGVLPGREDKTFFIHYVGKNKLKS